MNITARSNMVLINKKPFKVLVCVVTLAAFLCNTILFDSAWAVGMPSALTGRGVDSAGGSGLFKEMNVDTFTIPEYLGHIKDSYKGAGSEKIVIHIQDAHCNYAAQRKISEIIEYLNKEYGIDTINLEGGAKDYDLSIFTRIYDKPIREKTADYFVKEGLVNGAEYFAINNPEKTILWGIEDTNLYLDNLNVYRDSLKYKDEVDKHLKSINYTLSNLKTKIYSPELLQLDMRYSQYKAGTLEFKDYLAYLIQAAKDKTIDIKEFTNIYLLGQTLSEEGNIDFKKANNQRDDLIDKLQKKLSKKSLEELVLKTVEFRSEKIAQKDFYAYLTKKANLVGIELNGFPDLQRYIVYSSMYGAIDKIRVMEEMDKLENAIKETLNQNDKQLELSKLSKNLAILKNIFNISLTKEDYKYYIDNEQSFNASNYVTFISKVAPLYKITAQLDKNITDLDRYRENVSKFYEYSFKRDEVFLKNIKFGGNKKIAVVVTGGFHTENLCEIFKKKNIDYISVMPAFSNCDGYQCPYFNLLAGKKDGLVKQLYPIITPASAIQIASMLNAMAPDVWGKANINVFDAAVFIQEQNEKGRRFDITLADGSVIPFGQGDRVVRMSLNRLLNRIHQRNIDLPISQAYQQGKFKAVSDEARNEGAKRIRVIATALSNKENAEKLNKIAGQIEKGEVEINLVDVGNIEFDAHVGGEGIHINQKFAVNAQRVIDLVVHEAIAGITGDHFIAEAAEEGKTADAVAILASAKLLDAPIWQMKPTERREADRDFAQKPSASEAKLRKINFQISNLNKREYALILRYAPEDIKKLLRVRSLRGFENRVYEMAEGVGFDLPESVQDPSQAIDAMLKDANETDPRILQYLKDALMLLAQNAPRTFAITVTFVKSIKNSPRADGWAHIPDGNGVVIYKGSRLDSMMNNSEGSMLMEGSGVIEVVSTIIHEATHALLYELYQDPDRTIQEGICVHVETLAFKHLAPKHIAAFYTLFRKDLEPFNRAHWDETRHIEGYGGLGLSGEVQNEIDLINHKRDALEGRMGDILYGEGINKLLETAISGSLESAYKLLSYANIYWTKNGLARLLAIRAISENFSALSPVLTRLLDGEFKPEDEWFPCMVAEILGIINLPAAYDFLREYLDSGKNRNPKISIDEILNGGYDISEWDIDLFRATADSGFVPRRDNPGDINIADAGLDAADHAIVNRILAPFVEWLAEKPWARGLNAKGLAVKDETLRGRRVIIIGDDGIRNLFDLALKVFDASNEADLMQKAGISRKTVEALKKQHGHAGVLGNQVFVVAGAHLDRGMARRSLDDLINHEIFELELWQMQALRVANRDPDELANLISDITVSIPLYDADPDEQRRIERLKSDREKAKKVLLDVRDGLRAWMLKNPIEAEKAAVEFHKAADERVALLNEASALVRQKLRDVGYVVGSAMGLDRSLVERIVRDVRLRIIYAPGVQAHAGEEEILLTIGGSITDEAMAAELFRVIAAEFGHMPHHILVKGKMHGGVREAFDETSRRILFDKLGRFKADNLRDLALNAFIGEAFLEFRKIHPARSDTPPVSSEEFSEWLELPDKDRNEFLVRLYIKAASVLGNDIAGHVMMLAQRDMWVADPDGPRKGFDLHHMVGAHIILTLLGQEAVRIIKDGDEVSLRLEEVRQNLPRLARAMGGVLKHQEGVDFTDVDRFISAVKGRSDALASENRGFFKIALEWIVDLFHNIRLGRIAKRINSDIAHCNLAGVVDRFEKLGGWAHDNLSKFWWKMFMHVFELEAEANRRMIEGAERLWPKGNIAFKDIFRPDIKITIMGEDAMRQKYITSIKKVNGNELIYQPYLKGPYTPIDFKNMDELKYQLRLKGPDKPIDLKKIEWLHFGLRGFFGPGAMGALQFMAFRVKQLLRGKTRLKPLVDMLLKLANIGKSYESSESFSGIGNKKIGQMGKKANVSAITSDKIVVKDGRGRNKELELRPNGVFSQSDLISIRDMPQLRNLETRRRETSDGFMSLINWFIFEDIPVYTFDELVGDFFGTAIQGQGLILYSGLRNNPIALFHEFMHYLLDTGNIKLRLENNSLFFSCIAYSGAKIDVSIRLDQEALAIAAKNPIDNHYLLRALQRQLFQDSDKELTEKIWNEQGLTYEFIKRTKEAGRGLTREVFAKKSTTAKLSPYVDHNLGLMLFALGPDENILGPENKAQSLERLMLEELRSADSPLDVHRTMEFIAATVIDGQEDITFNFLYRTAAKGNLLAFNVLKIIAEATGADTRMKAAIKLANIATASERFAIPAEIKQKAQQILSSLVPILIGFFELRNADAGYVLTSLAYLQDVAAVQALAKIARGNTQENLSALICLISAGLSLDNGLNGLIEARRDELRLAYEENIGADFVNALASRGNHTALEILRKAAIGDFLSENLKITSDLVKKAFPNVTDERILDLILQMRGIRLRLLEADRKREEIKTRAATVLKEIVNDIGSDEKTKAKAKQILEEIKNPNSVVDGSIEEGEKILSREESYVLLGIGDSNSLTSSLVEKTYMDRCKELQDGIIRNKEQKSSGEITAEEYDLRMFDYLRRFMQLENAREVLLNNVSGSPLTNPPLGMGGMRWDGSPGDLGIVKNIALEAVGRINEGQKIKPEDFEALALAILHDAEFIDDRVLIALKNNPAFIEAMRTAVGAIDVQKVLSKVGVAAPVRASGFVSSGATQPTDYRTTMSGKAISPQELLKPLADSIRASVERFGNEVSAGENAEARILINELESLDITDNSAALATIEIRLRQKASGEQLILPGLDGNKIISRAFEGEDARKRINEARASVSEAIKYDLTEMGAVESVKLSEGVSRHGGLALTQILSIPTDKVPNRGRIYHALETSLAKLDAELALLNEKAAVMSTRDRFAYEQATEILRLLRSPTNNPDDLRKGIQQLIAPIGNMGNTAQGSLFENGIITAAFRDAVTQYELQKGASFILDLVSVQKELAVTTHASAREGNPAAPALLTTSNSPVAEPPVPYNGGQAAGMLQAKVLAHQFQQGEDALPSAPLTRMTTFEGRLNHSLAAIRQLVMEIGGQMVVYDIGVGWDPVYGPVTTTELADDLSGRAEVIGIDNQIPYYAVRQNNFFQTTTLFDKDGNLIAWFQEMGAETADSLNDVEKSKANELAKGLIEELKGEAVSYTDLQGNTITKNPIAAYEMDNLHFVHGDLFNIGNSAEASSLPKANIVRISNVLVPHFVEDLDASIKKALDSLADFLQEGSYVFIGYADPTGGKQEEYIVYRKNGNRFILDSYTFSFQADYTPFGVGVHLIDTPARGLGNELMPIIQAHSEWETFKKVMLKKATLEEVNKVQALIPSILDELVKYLSEKGMDAKKLGSMIKVKLKDGEEIPGVPREILIQPNQPSSPEPVRSTMAGDITPAPRSVSPEATPPIARATMSGMTEKVTIEERNKDTVTALMSEDDAKSHDPIAVVGLPWWIAVELKQNNLNPEAYLETLEREMSRMLGKKGYGDPTNVHKFKLFFMSKDTVETANNLNEILDGVNNMDTKLGLQEVVVFVPQSVSIDKKITDKFTGHITEIRDAYTDMDYSKEKGFPDVGARIAITRLVAWCKDAEQHGNQGAKEAALKALTEYISALTGEEILIVKDLNELLSKIKEMLLRIRPVNYEDIIDWRNSYEAVATAL